MNRKRKWVMQNAEQIGVWDGFDSAIIGIGERCGQPPIVVYDRDKMIEILMQEMDGSEAVEHLEFNIAGAWVGPMTPMLVNRAPISKKKRRRHDPEKLEELVNEIARLMGALVQIAENRDEPYAADFAKDIIERRKP